MENGETEELRVTASSSTTGGKSTFLAAFLFLDKQQREAMKWVYAFCRLADDAVDEAGTAAEKRVRLAACGQELEAVYAGRPESRLAQGLGQAVARYGLVRADLEAVIEGCRMDLEQVAYPDFAALEQYCRCVASAVGRLCVAIFGVTGESALAYADATGLALQLTNILRDVGEDYQRGRVYLPADELVRFGVTAAELDPANPPQGEARERLAGLLAFQAARARRYYLESDRLRPRGKYRQLLAGEVMKSFYRDVLLLVERLGPDVLNHRARPGRFRRAWVMAKALGQFFLPFGS